MRIRKKLFLIVSAIAMTVMLSLSVARVSEAAEKQTIYNSPYVTFAPDGKAWTTHAGDTNIKTYEYGEAVTTGIESTLRELREGEHYYEDEREGEVPVSKWVVHHPRGKCIHSQYPVGEAYHDLTYGTQICSANYFSGWISYCADCGEPVGNMFVYMSKEAAESIDYVESRKRKPMEAGRMDYYYLCPFCTNIEQGAAYTHECKFISYNRYSVMYDRNHGEEHGYSGDMYNSYHLYNNATSYDGQEVTPVTHLTSNTFKRVGYEFAGWNTRPDGSGEAYGDGAEILNLSKADHRHEETWFVDDNGELDNGTVTLYAQWRKSESALQIMPNGGKYLNSSIPTTITRDYGTAYTADGTDVECPKGYVVTYQTNGGEATDYRGNVISSVTGTTHFTGWSKGTSFKGQLKDNTYMFIAPDGHTDYIYANFAPNSIVLPKCKKEGYSFGGWYYDSAFKKPAGDAGDRITPTQNMTLYAQWVELILYSQDNYSANGGKGAVDLSWSQDDGNDKTYKVYQSTDASTWKQVTSATDIGTSLNVNETFDYSGESYEYTVPYNGMYNVHVYGAQGGDYESHTGGKGGYVYGTTFLDAGEVLTITPGGQDGFNGGGAGDPYANGGGATTVVSDKKGTLFIAGGGGGASESDDGSDGGEMDAYHLTGTADGESGQSGGGGGYLGGAAGEYVLHEHSDDCGVHVHSGDEINGGDCYRAESESKTCTVTRTHYSGTTSWFCTGCGTTRLFKTDGVKSAHSSCGSAPVYNTYKTTCPVCGAIGQNYTPNYSTSTHNYTETVYVLDCGLEGGYLCGKTEEIVEFSTPAYGGSNYVAEEWMNLFSSSPGKRAGDGKVELGAWSVGYLKEQQLEGVSAPDLAAPDTIRENTVTGTPHGSERVVISWTAPADNGTDYYHRVTSHLRNSSSVLCTSNITLNTLKTGIEGYYYIVDGQADTELADTPDAGEHFSFTKQPKVTVPVTEETQYLHVAAVDKAGNVGGTTHVKIRADAGGDGADAGGNGVDILWNLATGPITVEDTENTHPAGTDKWYVKADGSTPFTLVYDAYLERTASLYYQPNYSIFRSRYEEISGENILFTQSHAISDGNIVTTAQNLIYTTKDNPVLGQYPYMVTERSNRNRDLRTTQKFTLNSEYHGKEIVVYPGTGAAHGEDVVYSDETADKRHSVILIGDGEVPEITGMDNIDGEGVLEIGAADALSGLGDLYVEVLNIDNSDRITYYPEADGVVRIDLSSPMFDGDLQVHAVAVDNVGNETEQMASVTGFSMNAVIRRIRSPHEPIFQCGESGILTITTYGYADRIVVEFPSELEREHTYSREFTYANPSYLTEEKIQFMVPLNAEDGDYAIKVTAYKNGREMVCNEPELIVKGTLLQEIRTRLR